MRRRPDGTYEAIDWETAIREIAAKFAAIKARHGGESILYYGGGSQGNHLGGGYSRQLPRLADGPSAGFPRIYDLALEHGRLLRTSQRTCCLCGDPGNTRALEAV